MMIFYYCYDAARDDDSDFASGDYDIIKQ